MRARWRFLVAVAALAASPGTGAGDPVCQLSHMDRRQTTSRDCLACHDGTAGTAVGYRRLGAPARKDGHPVEVDYAAVAAGRPGEYRDPSTLPPAVALVQGRIECTTCHDGASTRRDHLAGGRELCLACHAF